MITQQVAERVQRGVERPAEEQYVEIAGVSQDEQEQCASPSSSSGSGQAGKEYEVPVVSVEDMRMHDNQ